ncbi:MAG: glycosyltransferase family 39 protein [Actinomycetes bacterium]
MRTRWLLVGAILVAFVDRLAVLASPIGNLNGDEGVTGLMADRIVRGHTYTFFPGQQYLGAVEPYLQAPFAWIAPHNAYVVRLPLVVISAFSVLLVFSVGRRVLGSERRALVAAWLYALGPAYALLYGGRGMGAYAVAPLLGLLALHFAVRHAQPGSFDVSAIGFVAGLGAWATVTTYYLILPAVLWTVGSLWTVARRRLLLLVSAALLGSAPFWIWMLRHRAIGGIGSLPHVAGPATRLGRLVADVLPEYLGVAWFGPRSVLPRVVWYVAVAGVLGLLTVAVVARRRSLVRLLLSRGTRRPFDVVLLASVIALAMYVASPYTWYAVEPRYLYPALPLLAWSAARIRVPIAAVALLSVATIAVYVDDYPAHWTRDLRAASGWLQKNGYTAAYADFRTAYTSDFVAGTAIAVVPYGPNPCRFPDLTRRVDASEHFAYLASTENVTEVLRAVPGAKSMRFGSVTVLTPPQPVRPWQVGLTSRQGTC